MGWFFPLLWPCQHHIPGITPHSATVPGDLLKATASLWCWFPALLLRCGGCESSSSGGRQEGRGFHSTWRPQNWAPGFPVGHQPLAQALPSPCWGTARFGKAKWWMVVEYFLKENAHHGKLITCHSPLCLSSRGEQRKKPDFVKCLVGFGPC